MLNLWPLPKMERNGLLHSDIFCSIFLVTQKPVIPNPDTKLQWTAPENNGMLRSKVSVPWNLCYLFTLHVFNPGTLMTIREPAAVPVVGLFGAVD